MLSFRRSPAFLGTTGESRAIVCIRPTPKIPRCTRNDSRSNTMLNWPATKGQTAIYFHSAAYRNGPRTKNQRAGANPVSR